MNFPDMEPPPRPFRLCVILLHCMCVLRSQDSFDDELRDDAQTQDANHRHRQKVVELCESPLTGDRQIYPIKINF